MTATMTEQRPTDTAFTAPAGAPIIGEIVTWDVDGITTTHDAILDALAGVGLPGSLARPVSFPDAFRRAMAGLGGPATIVRKVDEAPDLVRYQVTSEIKDTAGDCLVYTIEHMVVLHKETSSIECADPDTLARVVDATEGQRTRRSGKDVGRIMFRLFEDRRRQDVDLIPLRRTGGVYFVRLEGADVIDRAEGFLAALAGRLNRFPIARNRDNASVTSAVREKLAGLIAEYREGVEAFDASARESTLEAAAERVNTLAFKIESYADYLDDAKAGLLADLADAKRALARKLTEIAEARTAE